MDAPTYWNGWDTRAVWAIFALMFVATWHAFMCAALLFTAARLDDWWRSR